MREESLLTGIIGNKKLNKIMIEEFAPKEEDLKNLQSQKSKRGKKTKKKSQTGDLPEERTQ
jgi:hypothetical protein